MFRLTNRSVIRPISLVSVSSMPQYLALLLVVPCIDEFAFDCFFCCSLSPASWGFLRSSIDFRVDDHEKCCLVV